MPYNPHVEHALDWSKLAELLPQLGREYARLAARYRIVLTVLAMLPPLLIPLEAAKWFSRNPAVITTFVCIYLLIAAAIFVYTTRWVENVRSFGQRRIMEDRLCSRTLDRIERDHGKSGEMSFEEIYLTDGSGLERRTRKQIIYSENDIEVNMDRGQKLFANNNVPLMINTAIVAAYCLFTIIGGFVLPYDAIQGQGKLMVVQGVMLVCVPAAIFVIQGSYRQHLLNLVIAEQLLEYITDDDAREAMDSFVPQLPAEEAGNEEYAEESTGVESLQAATGGDSSEDPGDEGVQAQA